MNVPTDMDSIQLALKTYSLGLPRLYLVFTILPALSSRFLGGAMIRNGVLMSIALFLYPINEASLPADLELLDYFIILIKEITIGLVIGYMATVPFWVAQGVGFLIDNQRGAAMASIVNPLLGEQTSPIGLFFSQVFTTLFVVSGMLLTLLVTILLSYKIWPVGVLYPEFMDQLDTLALAQLDLLMEMTVVLAAPVVLAMFLAEFALALVSRFSPQLNVFFLAMPIKSGIAFFVLVIYMRYFVGHLVEYMNTVPDKILELLTLPLG